MDCIVYRTKMCDCLAHLDEPNSLPKMHRITREHIIYEECSACKLWYDFIFAPNIAKLNQKIKEIVKNGKRTN